ncbi:hypothetical protein D3C78_1870380 [compost metagenome]
MAEKNDFFERTTELNSLIQENFVQLDKAGVLTEDQKDCKALMKYLNTEVNDLPVYILLDNEKVLLVGHGFEEFQQKMIEIIQ